MLRIIKTRLHTTLCVQSDSFSKPNYNTYADGIKETLQRERIFPLLKQIKQTNISHKDK